MTTNDRCECDFRTRMVGDGCRYCNPQYYINILEDQIKEGDPLLNEMAAILHEIIDDAKSYESRSGKVVSWREQADGVLQKYCEQQLLTNPNPKPPQP